MNSFKIPLAYFIFIVCLAAASPSGGWLDSSELITGAYFLGISHAPGQPLFSIILKAFQLLPFGSIAFRSNISSALFLMLSFIMLSSVLQAICPDLTTKRKKLIINLCIVFCILGSSFMLQGVRSEVYALNLFLFASIIYSALVLRAVYMTLFLAGISLACHPLIIVACLPGVALLIFDRKSFQKTILPGLLFFVTGASIYLYLPIRAAAQPIYSFGTPLAVQNFIWVITAKLYRAYDSPLISKMLDNAIRLLAMLSDQLNIVFLILSAIGFYLLGRKNLKLCLSLLLILILNGYILLSNMHFDVSNPDLNGYAMITLAVIGMSACFAVAQILQVIGKNLSQNRLLNFMILGLFVILPITQLIKFGSFYNKSNDWSSNDMARNITSSIPYDGIVWTGSFATFSILTYESLVANYRPDMKILYAGFLANQGYIQNTDKNYPELKLNEYSGELAMNTGLLSYLRKAGNQEFLELAIKERAGDYAIRYENAVLQKLKPFQWFFQFDGLGYSTKSGYYDFWDEKILPLYEISDYEFRKNTILALYLHAKYAELMNDGQMLREIIDRGLKMDPKFEPFLKLEERSH
jgi:hypothetical protein